MPVPPPNSYAPGTQLTVGSHQVQIIKYISEGGFAYVYTCTIDPPFHGSNIACLKRVAVPNKWQLSLLRQEVDAMRRLRGNKHIVSYIDSHASRLGSATNGEQQYEVFLLMEYCENNGLIGFMNTRLTNKLTEPEILTIMYEVTIAVAMCHHLEPPLIHRDIKIENILIDAKGTYKLCDFGSSVPYIPAPKTPQELQATRDDIMNHTTPQYRAPEMIDLTKGFPLDDKSDIWALGCFLYKLCYYTTPFESPNQKSMQDLEQAILGCSHTLRFHDQPGSMFSPRLKNVIKCCLREDPRRRPNVVQLLGEICQMKGVPVPSVIPYSVKHSKHPEALVNAHIKQAKSKDPSSKRYLKDNKPADPFSTIDKSKLLKSATVNIPTVGKLPSKPSPAPKVEDDKPLNIQNYVQQALNRSSEDLCPRVEDDKNGTLEFLRSKETDSQSRQDTGGSFKALKHNIRKISTGNSGTETTSQGHNSGWNRSSMNSIKNILTGNSYRKSSSPEEMAPSNQDTSPEQPKRLSIQRRMHLLMNSKDESIRMAKGYGRYTDVKDSDEINAINKTHSPLSSDEEHYIHRDRLRKGPPKVPESLSSHRLAKSISPVPHPRPRSVGPGIRAKTEELPPLPPRKIPPKPAKPKHLKGRSDRFDSRRTSVSSEFSVPDIDDLEQEFSKRYPSYV